MEETLRAIETIVRARGIREVRYCKYGDERIVIHIGGKGALLLVLGENG